MKTTIGIKLIVGLGNPGERFEKTRHNAGFWLVNLFCKKQSCGLKAASKFNGYVGKTRLLGHEFHILLPTTFMNLSGMAVARLSSFYKIPTESILVVHDELDFLPGMARLKRGGGAGGHNGLQNIVDQLNSNSFWRLRIGIGKPKTKEEVVDYVVNIPKKNEFEQIQMAINNSIEIIPDLIVGNFEKAVNILHSTNKEIT